MSWRKHVALIFSQLEATPQKVRVRLDQTEAAIVDWLYPELAEESGESIVPTQFDEVAAEIRRGTVRPHACLSTRGGIVARNATPFNAAIELERGRRGWRRIAQWIYPQRRRRGRLFFALNPLYIDASYRHGLADLYGRLCQVPANGANYSRAITEWKLSYLRVRNSTDLRIIGDRFLDEALKRKWEEDELERRNEAHLRQLRLAQQAAEEKRLATERAERQAREAAEEAARAPERARLARERAEREAIERRKRAKATACQALAKIAQLDSMADTIKDVPHLPVRAFRKRLRDPSRDLRAVVVSLDRDVDDATISRLAAEVNRPLNLGPPHRCGALARRVIIRVRDCGDFRDLAIMEMLRLMAVSAHDQGVINDLWCSINSDRVVRLVYREESRPWCTVFAELAFHRASAPEHLNIVLSIHIPFGEGADPSFYPTEESTARVRPTQTLTLLPKLIVSAGQSSQNQDEQVNEQSESDRDTWSRSQRSSNTHRTTVEHRWGTSHSKSERKSEMETTGFTFPYEKRETKDESEDGRSETSYSNQTGWDTSRSSELESGKSSENERALRKRQSATNQSQREVRVEFTPTAVGVDYSDASKLLGAWRSHPVNAKASAVFDTLCHDLPGLAEALPDAIYERRRHGRAADVSSDAAFWSEVAKWAVVERPGLTPAKLVVQQDGTARPIDTTMVRSLVQGMRPELQDLTDQVFALPPGNEDDE